MPPGDYKIPFDSQGNQLHWANPHSSNSADWRDNYVFRGRLHIGDMRRGYRAKYLMLEDDYGRTYSMFIPELLDLVKRGAVIRGEAWGPWTFRKRGQNYGVRYVGTE